MYAGMKVTVSSQASMTPTATKMPNIWTGGMGVSASEPNPAAEVSDV